jgi:phosphonate transport system substrate-binding protein
VRLNGVIDATAIDSTVLESLPRMPIRVIETLGPSPIPPVVVSRSVRPALRQALESALLDLELGLGPAARFVRVTDADYDPIRRMARGAAQLAAWTLEPSDLHMRIVTSVDAGS